MPKGYHHLTSDQRCQLSALKDSGERIEKIAAIIAVSRFTIYRELARNSSSKKYNHREAREKAIQRRSRASNRPRKMNQEQISLIEEKLRLQWSPEQISGWLKRHKEVAVSHETIYRHVEKDKRAGGTLYRDLRHNGKKYNKRGRGKAGRGCIPGRVDISERPAIVEEKSRIGDWEVDTIIGSQHKGAVVSMVDRHSKMTMLQKVPRKTAQEVELALKARLGQCKGSVHTVTSDNGKEFANHIEISRYLGAKMFFARPYHSWERGLNEHTNGLIRQYLPKDERLDTVSNEIIAMIEERLNNRPRKVLDFQTPIEVFNRHRSEATVVALRS